MTPEAINGQTSFNDLVILEKLRGLVGRDALVYYPGCGEDDTPAKFFPNTISVDFDPRLVDHFGLDFVTPPSLPSNFMLADYNHPPFADETFNAVYCYDTHADKEEFAQILKALKVGGFVVFSDPPCGEGIKFADLVKIPNLKLLPISVATFDGDFYTFRKTEQVI